MSNQTCKTVRIKSSDPKSQGAFVEINETDFDSKKHELYVERGNKAPAATGGSKAPAIPLSVTAQKLVDDNGLDVSKIVGTGTDGAITVADVKAAVAAKKAIKASPEAIAFAEEAGFDLTGVVGTGPDGEITVENVQDAIEKAEEESE